MKIFACAALALLGIGIVDAASSGNIALCSATDDEYGKSGSIMDWVEDPIRSHNYSLRTGDGHPSKDPTTYVPGEYTNIHIRALAVDMKYRGLVLYAVDQNEQKVGEWELPDIPGYSFWIPPSCQNAAVVHRDAALKHYHYAFRFRNPPAETGPITFRCLIKQGPANTGRFFWPNLNGDVTLVPQDPNIVPMRKWVRGGLGENCNDVCANTDSSYTCDLQSMLDADLSEKIDAAVNPFFACKKPYLNLCHDVSPTSSDEGWCWYRHQECGCLGTIPGCTNTPTTCEASSTDPAVGRRFCACHNAARVAAELAAARDAEAAKEAGQIAGAVVGGVFGTALVVGAVVMFIRYKTSSGNTEKMTSVSM